MLKPEDELLTFTFQVPRKHTPALRSAVMEISGTIGNRIVGARNRPAHERALTSAVIAVGALRAAVTAQVPVSDRNYK